jgi:hypothetical protein
MCYIGGMNVMLAANDLEPFGMSGLIVIGVLLLIMVAVALSKNN